MAILHRRKSGSQVVLTSRIPQVTAQARAGVVQAVRDTAFAIEGRAKTLAPVDTGFLMNSIGASVYGLTATGATRGSDLTWYVNVGAEYGIHVEFGTHIMGAQPFLLPAARVQEPIFLRRVADAIRRAK